MAFRAAASTPGGNTTTVAVTIPATAQVGDVMWLFWMFLQTSSNTDPTGWTLRESIDNATSSRLRRYTKTVVSGDIGATLTLTCGTANRQAAAVVVMSGVDTTTPEDAGTPASVNYSSDTATYAIPTVTTSATRDIIAVHMDRGSNPGTTWSPPTGFTEATEVINTGSGCAAGDWGYWDAKAAGAVSGDFTNNSTNTRNTTSTVVVNPASGGSDFSGDVTTSSSGTFSVTVPLVDVSGSVAQASGSGALSFLLISAGTVGAIDRAGAGTLTITGTPAVSGAVNTSGVGTLFVAPAEPSMSGEGTLSITATVAFSGDVDPSSGTGQLSFQETGYVTNLGEGTLSITGSPGPTGSITRSGEGTLEVSSKIVPLSSSGTFSVSGSPSIYTTQLLSSSGTLSISSTVGHSGFRGLSGVGTLSVSGKVNFQGEYNFSGAGFLIRSGTPGITHDIDLSGSGQWKSNPALILSGVGWLSVRGQSNVERYLPPPPAPSKRQGWTAPRRDFS